MDNLKQLMQLGQQMQEKMKGLQDSLDQERITSSSGGGMVKVTVDGKGSVKLVKIDPTCVNPSDVEMLEDLVLGALSDAQDKAQSVYQRKMRKATGGFPMNIPGLPKLF
jgi:hypothetical protein|tara:strand:- start:1770 stop:2096 length:327 start_codon:yes stop_codon:yes gene_type:complete